MTKPNIRICVKLPLFKVGSIIIFLIFFRTLMRFGKYGLDTYLLYLAEQLFGSGLVVQIGDSHRLAMSIDIDVADTVECKDSLNSIVVSRLSGNQVVGILHTLVVIVVDGRIASLDELGTNLVLRRAVGIIADKVTVLAQVGTNYAIGTDSVLISK